MASCWRQPKAPLADARPGAPDDRRGAGSGASAHRANANANDSDARPGAACVHRFAPAGDGDRQGARRIRLRTAAAAAGEMDANVFRCALARLDRAAAAEVHVEPVEVGRHHRTPRWCEACTAPPVDPQAAPAAVTGFDQRHDVVVVAHLGGVAQALPRHQLEGAAERHPRERAEVALSRNDVAAAADRIFGRRDAGEGASEEGDGDRYAVGESEEGDGGGYTIGEGEEGDGDACEIGEGS